MASISIEFLHHFHRIDREVFSRLLLKTMLKPSESLLVMSLWLWLEAAGYPCLIDKMVGLPNAFVKALANEALVCLKALENGTSLHIPQGGGLPLTTTLMEREISLQFFIQKRFTAISGIKSFLNNVCSRIFADILKYLIGTPPNFVPDMPLVVPGFPHPLFGELTINPVRPLTNHFEGKLWGWFPGEDVGEDERTLFLTFSRGFPVTEEEVRHLFIDTYGDCVKCLNMGTGNVNGQTLYATMVLDSVANMDRVLGGKPIAKFRMNGKHIWARKYERREQQQSQ